ncbi:hypothetical protein Ga0123462_0116 [Mariprofundus ferrinatatus]|uniref:Uncharacterized protein n=1 Tax=Mariprofundus ferrinatatus TaxID=1921087 RepID=A0A2K8L104_9PROT|nr:hypothetical protein [Mariprofundus ferrinatatus]ATX80995.1 hypothetical protein Ga0123462_0116 [Mariprofundus ferrinatatus]
MSSGLAGDGGFAVGALALVCALSDFQGWQVVSTSDLIFFGVFFWVLFVTARLAVFAIKIDVQLKKRLWPVVIYGLAGVLLLVAYLLDFPPKGYAVLAVALFVIVYSNLKGFYFCDSCGMLANKKILTTVEKCTKCGAKIQR